MIYYKFKLVELYVSKLCLFNEIMRRAPYERIPRQPDYLRCRHFVFHHPRSFCFSSKPLSGLLRGALLAMARCVWALNADDDKNG